MQGVYRECRGPGLPATLAVRRLQGCLPLPANRKQPLPALPLRAPWPLAAEPWRCALVPDAGRVDRSQNSQTQARPTPRRRACRNTTNTALPAACSLQPCLPRRTRHTPESLSRQRHNGTEAPCHVRAAACRYRLQRSHDQLRDEQGEQGEGRCMGCIWCLRRPPRFRSACLNPQWRRRRQPTRGRRRAGRRPGGRGQGRRAAPPWFDGDPAAIARSGDCRPGQDQPPARQRRPLGPRGLHGPEIKALSASCSRNPAKTPIPGIRLRHAARGWSSVSQHRSSPLSAQSPRSGGQYQRPQGRAACRREPTSPKSAVWADSAQPSARSAPGV